MESRPAHQTGTRLIGGSARYRHQPRQNPRPVATPATAQALTRHALRAFPIERSSGRRDDLVAGTGKRILACTGYEFEGPLAASVTFYAAGRMYRTDWFRAQIVVREGR